MGKCVHTCVACYSLKMGIFSETGWLRQQPSRLRSSRVLSCIGSLPKTQKTVSGLKVFLMAAKQPAAEKIFAKKY